MKNSRFLCSLIICLAVYFCQEVPVLGSPSRNEALVLMEKEKFASAAKHLESLVRTSAPELDVHEIHHALGYCYEKLKKWEQAAKYYEMAASPGYILADYAIYRLAQIHQERENHEKAIVWYRRLIERYPQSHHVFGGA
jgi:tetratricopeptide (TPR) repeat protein